METINSKNKIGKHGNQLPMLDDYEANKPLKMVQTSPGIVSSKLSQPKPSLTSAPERMHASKPWKPKGGRAIDAAKNDDPGSMKPSMKVGKGPGYDDDKGYTMNRSTKSGYTKV